MSLIRLWNTWYTKYTWFLLFSLPVYLFRKATRPLRPQPPPPLRAQWPYFWGGILFLASKIVCPPPPLSGRATKKTSLTPSLLLVRPFRRHAIFWVYLWTAGERSTRATAAATPGPAAPSVSGPSRAQTPSPLITLVTNQGFCITWLIRNPCCKQMQCNAIYDWNSRECLVFQLTISSKYDGKKSSWLIYVVIWRILYKKIIFSRNMTDYL